MPKGVGYPMKGKVPKAAGKRARGKIIKAERGFDDIVKRPTRFLAGERNLPERVKITPVRGGRGSRRGVMPIFPEVGAAPVPEPRRAEPPMRAFLDKVRLGRR